MGMIYLIRHAEPQFDNGHGVTRDPEGPRYYGAMDLELSREGREHAASLKEPLEHLRESTLITSSMRRAQHTAELIFPEKPYRVERDFREIDLREWEGRTFQEVKEEDGKAFEERWNHMDTFRSPGGESFQDLRERVIPAFRALLEKELPSPLVITAHGGVFLVILQEILEIPLQRVFSLRQDYCGVHVLQKQKKGTLALRQLNWHPEIL